MVNLRGRICGAKRFEHFDAYNRGVHLKNGRGGVTLFLNIWIHEQAQIHSRWGSILVGQRKDQAGVGGGRVAERT